jgi:hypothetical protein
MFGNRMSRLLIKHNPIEVTNLIPAVFDGPNSGPNNPIAEDANRGEVSQRDLFASRSRKPSRG